MKQPNYKNLPESPGVYIYKDAKGKLLYIGKAANLKRRVSSYFHLRPLASPQQGEDIIVGENNPERVPLRRDDEGLPSTIPRRLLVSHDTRIEKLVSEIKKIEYKKTDSALEALILEAELIKKFQPPYNIREKDDKSFLYVEITKEPFPRLLLVRGKALQSYELRSRKIFGPFISASNIREALRILRKIFSWNTHSPEALKKIASRPCFDYEIGLCPGACVGAVSRQEYKKTIRKLALFFKGKKRQIVRETEKEMNIASKQLDFEKAEKLKRELFALRHIQDVALINEERVTPKSYKLKAISYRIEGYDISNISGTFAVGAMAVFENGEPKKSEYRKFKIRSLKESNDVGMLKEVLERRLTHTEWRLPNLMLIDGGKGQVNIVEQVLKEHGTNIPVVGIAKGPERKRNDVYGNIPDWTDEKTLIKVRDEAHRFAISYHRALRNNTSLHY